VVGAQHRARPGEPAFEDRVHLRLAMHAARLDRRRGQRQHQRAVGIAEQAERDAVLDDEGGEPRRDVHDAAD
jgi:hypothetical protein